MDNAPLVSIIITTCKRKMDILERAIKSATSQTYDNTEIIVINDWPEYEGIIRERLEKYSGIRFISNVEQSGACVSRNKGIEAAHGEFIALLDDDDEWLPGKLEKQVAQADEDTVLVYCDISAIKDGKELKSDPDRAYPEGEVMGDILGSNFVGGCSVALMKKSAVIGCGGFDSDFRSCQDLDLWIKLAKCGKFKAVREKLVRYAVGDASITGSFDRRLQGWEYILEKYSDDYRDHPDSYRQFTSTMVLEAAKRESLDCSVNMCKKYGHLLDFIRGRIMKILGIY